MVFLVNHLSLLALSVSAVTLSVSGALFTDSSQLPPKNYDFIIIGGECIFPVRINNKIKLTVWNLAGAGGGVLASRLTEVAGFQVLLIEAGSALISFTNYLGLLELK